MTNKGIIPIFITGTFIFSLIITVPIVILSNELSKYSKIDESLPFTYVSSNSSAIEDLNLISDIGNIEIRYIYGPVDYSVKIKVNIEITGLFTSVKSYLDFFKIEWENSSSPLNFTLELISDIWFDASLFLTKNVVIIVNLNANILFDLNSTINEEGNFEISVPWGSKIKNLAVNVNRGNILYNFQSCTLEGNITGKVNSGNIELHTFDIEYSQNSNWSFVIDSGDLELILDRQGDLGANITGLAYINNGELYFSYNDYNDNVGAVFIVPLGNYEIPDCIINGYISCPLDGFHYNEPPLDLDEGNHIFTSHDLQENRVKNYFNITFLLNNGIFSLGSLTSVN